MSGAPEYSAENVEKALYQLYFDPSVQVKDQAQQWLTKAQRAKEAWKFAWVLLDKDKATEVQFFGASCLVSKISAAWNDVSDTDISMLRDHLFEQLLSFCSLPEKRIVLTRLCVAFSSFIINCTIRGIWPTAFSDIMEKLQEGNPNASAQSHQYFALLEILTVLPEEYNSSHLVRSNKASFMHLLRGGIPSVTKLLTNLFDNPHFKLRVIKCLASWIALGIPPPDSQDLVIKVLESVKDPELFEGSIDCLLNAFCSPILTDYPNTVKKYLPIILSYQPMLKDAIKEQDSETLLGLTKVICSLAENQTKVILKSCTDPQFGLGLISLVMECTNVPLQYPADELSSPISFTFWYTFQDEVQALSSEESLQVQQYVLPFFYKLIDVLLDKASYPSDNSHNSWSADEKEQHRIYRIDISDTLMYVLEMLSTNVLLVIFQRFSNTLQQISDIQQSWHAVETCLFGIQSIVETLTESSNEIPCLENLANVLPQIPLASVQLADTLLYTISTLTEWLHYHPESLQSLVQIVLTCMGNSELSLSSVLTLRRLTRECANQMVPYGSLIMEHISKLFVQGTLRGNEESWLIQSAGHILSVLPESDYVKHTENLLVMHIHQLDALSKDEPSPPNRNSILRILELLSHLFSSLDRRKHNEDGEIMEGEHNKNQHIITLLQQLMPIFREILNRWVRDVTVVETLCSLYNRSIRTLVDAFEPLLAPLCELLATVYQAYPYHSVLELVEQLLLVFGSDEKHMELITILLQSVIATSQSVFERNLHCQHPDIAQGFMYLLTTICRKQSSLFQHLTTSGKADLGCLFHCGILTLCLPDSESAKAGASFIVELFNLHTHNQIASSVISQSGCELVKVILKAIGGASPRTSMDHFADLLFVISRSTSQGFNAWMSESLSHVDIPNERVDSNQKNIFHKQLLREQKSKRKYREAVKEFTLVCRGLHGTEYANGS